jgi:cullin 1
MAQQEYKERPENIATMGKIDFTVQILTQGHWPSYKAFEPQLPAVMSQCLKVFSDNYLSHDDTAKRRLSWQWTLGGASVKATYGRKSYDLQVSTLQAVLLSMFSGCDEPITLKEVESKIGIKMESMKRVLHSLLYGKYKILKRIPGEACASDSKAKGSINDNDSFYVDPNFSSPMKVAVFSPWPARPRVH